jgi:hypothetical protein
MAYTRGDNYIWSSGERTHLWIADGEDGWAECIWNEGGRHPNPSGVGVPQGVMDEYVVMRFAELVRSGDVAATIDRAVTRHAGNFGCAALNEIAPALKAMASQA